jgi:Ca-activated chloride channel family protein
MDQAFKWGNSAGLGWLALILLLTGVYFYFEKKFSQKLNQAFGKKVATYLSQSVSLSKRKLIFNLQMLALFFIVIALARPQAGESQQEVKSEGVELLILADVSESMMSEDVKPSRLSQMKIELSKLLELMPGNKIGIIAFAGSAALLSPLTSDPNALRMYIDSLDTSSVSSQGTSFETALSYAKEAFDKGGVTQDQQSRTTRAVLIVSDGEDQEPGALEAAKKLTKEGVRIFSMAYGTEKGGAIPVHDRNGNMTGFKKDKSGQTILTQVKGDFLKNLAEAGEGQFYFAIFNGDHLKKFTEDLNQLEKTQFQTNMMTQYDEKFTWPLSLGLLFLFVSLFLNDFKKPSQDWAGRYEDSP